ncbi:carbonic anhydrase [Clostridium boliviensis]|uniref:carbonic anhydrase n=1 Tax=Clostridium boliviensis TaxID=318465 RepID=A0ABU4GSR2_9CLOT|nr:carbonic anhydrase [Clostridium boliviensis]MDW2800614.1 carbonic anhydrase [Clostridium boliviensis]
MLEEILEFNREFVKNKSYETYIANKYPQKKTAIVSCMDTRLTELLPAALGLKNGDAKIIKNAGGVISHPFGSVMRSLLIGIYELDVREILVIGHTDCGARHTDSVKMIEKMKERGITQKDIDLIKYYGIDFESWLGGFEDLEQSIKKSVELIRCHPLVPEEIRVYGLVIDSVTGELSKAGENGL